MSKEVDVNNVSRTAVSESTSGNSAESKPKFRIVGDEVIEEKEFPPTPSTSSSSNDGDSLGSALFSGFLKVAGSGLKGANDAMKDLKIPAIPVPSSRVDAGSYRPTPWQYQPSALPALPYLSYGSSPKKG